MWLRIEAQTQFVHPYRYAPSHDPATTRSRCRLVETARQMTPSLTLKASFLDVASIGYAGRLSWPERHPTSVPVSRFSRVTGARRSDFCRWRSWPVGELTYGKHTCGAIKARLVPPEPGAHEGHSTDTGLGASDRDIGAPRRRLMQLLSSFGQRQPVGRTLLVRDAAGRRSVLPCRGGRRHRTDKRPTPDAGASRLQ